MAALLVEDLVENAEIYSRPLAILIASVYFIYGWIFLRNTRMFPRRRPRQAWLLVAQIVLSLPLQSNLTVMTVITIPLVLERRRWKTWTVSTIVLVALRLALHQAMQIYKFRAQLAPNMTPVAIAVAVISGILEVIAWHVFAFVAAVLLVKFDEERSRLAILNAEMKGAQVLLMESGRLAERLRISRELHDSLGHHLTSLSLQLQVAEHLPDDQLRPKLAESRFLARLLLAEIREAVSQWRSETSPALPEALRSLSDGMPGLAVQLEMESVLPATPPPVTHALFRCAQEALTNAMRHGAAANVQLSLQHCEQNLQMRIADDGAGCGELAPGNGLRGMISRVTELGGAVSFDSAPGKGFRIDIQIPVPEVALR